MVRTRSAKAAEVQETGSKGELPELPYAAWAVDVSTVESVLKTSITKGLTSDEVEERRARYGPNELEKEPPTPFWKLVLEQVISSMHMKERGDTHASDLTFILIASPSLFLAVR